MCKQLAQGLTGLHVYMYEYGASKIQNLGQATSGFAVTWRCLVSNVVTMLSRGRQVGDLGNVQADTDGKVVETRYDRLISLHGQNNIIGRAVNVRSSNLIHDLLFLPISTIYSELTSRNSLSRSSQQQQNSPRLKTFQAWNKHAVLLTDESVNKVQLQLTVMN